MGSILRSKTAIILLLLVLVGCATTPSSQGIEVEIDSINPSNKMQQVSFDIVPAREFRQGIYYSANVSDLEFNEKAGAAAFALEENGYSYIGENESPDILIVLQYGNKWSESVGNFLTFVSLSAFDHSKLQVGERDKVWSTMISSWNLPADTRRSVPYLLYGTYRHIGTDTGYRKTGVLFKDLESPTLHDTQL